MDVVFATYTAMVYTPDGGSWLVRGGEHWPAEDAVVKAAPPGLFTPDGRYGARFSSLPPEMAEPPVEQVTAAPGETRGRVRRG